jgi:hypothetical protein
MQKPGTHAAHSKAMKLAQPCAAWHLTFGGKCLNCGYVPPDVCNTCGKPVPIPGGIHCCGRCAERANAPR